MSTAESLFGLAVVTPFFALCAVLLIAKPCPGTVAGFALQVGAVAFYGAHYLAARRRDREAARRAVEQFLERTEPRP